MAELAQNSQLAQRLNPKFVKFSAKLSAISERFEHSGTFKGLPKFNIMFAGRSGLGKTTFIQSMFCTEEMNPSIFNFQTSKIAIKEGDKIWCFTIIDTPGYKLQINNDKTWNCLTTYIDSKLKHYEDDLQSPDERVHCLVYFIDPSGISKLDLAILKHVNDRVNILPVIAKADTLTILENRQVKEEVIEKLKSSNINFYKYEVPKFLCNFFQHRVPFSVMGSTVVSHTPAEAAKVREYPWGNANIRSLEYSDFVIFELALRSNISAMIDCTNKFHVIQRNWQELPLITREDVEYVINMLKCRKLRLQDDLRQTEIDIALFEKHLSAMPSDS